MQLRESEHKLDDWFTREDQIWRWDTATSNWARVEGAAKNVDVYNADCIVVTNAANEVFQWLGGRWKKLTGACKQASITAKNIYCVNRAGEIFKA